MKEVKKEIDKINEAGDFGVTQINDVKIHSGGVDVYVEGTCFSIALDKLQEIANKHKLLLYVTAEETDGDEFIIRLH